MLEVDYLHMPGMTTLAQDGLAVPPGESGEVALGGQGGDTGGTGTGTSGSFLTPSFMFIMLGVLVVMIIMTSMGPRKEKKRRAAMLTAVKKHDRVQTIGGVIGAIVELKPDYVVLKVDESANTRITFARSAIQQILTADDKAAVKTDA